MTREQTDALLLGYALLNLLEVEDLFLWYWSSAIHNNSGSVQSIIIYHSKNKIEK